MLGSYAARSHSQFSLTVEHLLSHSRNLYQIKTPPFITSVNQSDNIECHKHCFDSLAIRLRSEDHKHLIPTSEKTWITGLAYIDVEIN